MPLTLQRDLDRRNVAFDHDFFFKSRNFDFKMILKARALSLVAACKAVIRLVKSIGK